MRVALCLLLLTAATACSHSESAPVEAAAAQSDTIGTSPEATSFYSVDVYDPERDASADLTSTIARATKDGKRILLEVGGLW
ncbi:MAG: hypothetical protein ACJA0P_004079 [Planctomycetota bacterium]|jgi:hypothetical protein